MIELKRLKLINWHNFENVTFDCARLTYMIGVNAVGKTTILDAIRYCLTTNRNFNALGNKKSGRTLQGSVHAKQRGENAYRRPGRTVAYIGAEFWDSVKRTPFVIAVRVESEGPMQELHPGDQTWYISEDGITLEKLPFLAPRTGAPSAREDFKPAVGRLSYTRSPSEARDRICRALGIGRASSPLGKKFNEVFQMGTSMDEIPNFREFLYQYILPQPELDLDALQGDRVELENLHAVLARRRPAPPRWNRSWNTAGKPHPERQTPWSTGARPCWPAPRPTPEKTPSGRGISTPDAASWPSGTPPMKRPRTPRPKPAGPIWPPMGQLRPAARAVRWTP